MYNYLENLKSDIMEYLEENNIKVTTENREEMEQQLYEDLWVEDSVTGNASGSYTFSTYQAEKNLVGNLDLLKEALIEFGCESINILEKGAEWCDVTIRCYLLGQALNEVLDKVEKNEE